ncbi:MAG: hypothetical protein FWF84_04100, partial [Kiritimatiellaeota bacterium]|nr:hypothetical protein [Kiritimatiellota bacterium]
MVRRLALMVAGVVLAAGMAEANPDVPLLRVPKLRTAPVIDGVLSAGEWQGAAAVSALVSYGSPTPTIAPPIQQATFYVGYDDKHLYIAMHSPHKEGTYPQARVKEDNSMMVLYEDHVEIEICKNTREQATIPGYGFYKIMTNPRGATIDQWMYNGTIGTEELWSIGGDVKCTVTPTAWDLEMAIELDQMRIESLDMQSLLLWLCRTDFCNGTYFLTWGPGYWLGWNTIPEVTFDPNAPAVQLANIGDVMEGNPDFRFDITDTAGQERSITGNVKVLNKAGDVLCDETATVSVPANASASLSLAKGGLAIDETGNARVVTVTEGDTI